MPHDITELKDGALRYFASLSYDELQKDFNEFVEQLSQGEEEPLLGHEKCRDTNG